MNTPLSWIKAYVPDLDCTDQEYTDAMTLTGTKVEGFERLDKNLDKIIVGKILEIAPHPDADHLAVCQVQIDEEGNSVQIVTGAPNVAVGQKVPVVLEGGSVAGSHHTGAAEGGIKIKAGKLRGVESYGMMCSIDELGSSTDFYPDAAPDGIYILSDNEEYKDAPVGSDAVELLGLHDTVFEYEITSNRVDCFGVIGIAREAAATFRKDFCPPVVKETGNGEKASDYIQVEIKDPDLCPRYIARVVENIHLAPSPEWMQRRLAACGIRPINNIVDITNYVMEEYSQPMHAFDYDTIAGHKIVVRRAEDGEAFTTLDGQDRTMDGSMLMICDADKAIAIGGVMGGENSKITDDVQTMVFESACFNGTNIRLTSKKLGLATEAAAKFTKGLDPNTAMEAINRACQLIDELGAGEVVGGCVDVYPAPKGDSRVGFDADKINAMLGTEVPEEQMIAYFKKIDLGYDPETKEVIVPSWRQDIARLADLAEEVARFYGYDKIPTTLPSGAATAGGLSFAGRIENIARDMAERFGFSEGYCYSFESPKVFDKLRLDEDDPLRQTVTILNPLGEDYSVMRTLPVNGILTSLAINYNRRNKNVRLYEIGNIYLPKQLPLTELPEERKQFTLGFYGDGDFFDMKGVVEEFLEKVGLKQLVTYDPKAGKNFLHPGRQANMIYDNTVIGYLGEVHPDVAESYGLGEKTYLAVLDLPEVVSRATFDVKYTGIAKYPAVTRDIAMVMEKDILAGDVEAVIRQRGGKLLESCTLFDVYEGAQIRTGYKSMAYSLTFRAQDHTLEDKEVNAVMAKILHGLKEMGIELRA